jgi:DNA-3-methyladenine glycosylase II
LAVAGLATDPLAGLAHRRVSVDPVAPYRLPGAIPDGVLRRRDGVLERVAGHEGRIVLLRAARPDRDGPVVMGAWAEDDDLAVEALERWRRTLGVDVDHRLFLEQAWHDPVLGPLVRRRPWLRPAVRYRPHEALVWAICEQLIEFVDALRIERGLVRLAGLQCPRTGLRDAPTPQAILDLAPAQIESLGLSGRRTQLLRETCRLLVRGLDLEADPRDPVWQRLRAVPGLGSWTLSVMALRGQGEPDASPSGDLGLLKSVGRLLHAGEVELAAGPPRYEGEWSSAPRPIGGPAAPSCRDERGRAPLATEHQVHELVSRFSPWRGYAAEHLFLA